MLPREGSSQSRALLHRACFTRLSAPPSPGLVFSACCAPSPPLELPPAASRGGWPAPLPPPRGDEASPPAFPLLLYFGPPRADITAAGADVFCRLADRRRVLLSRPPRRSSLAAPASFVTRARPYSPASGDRRRPPRGSQEKAWRPLRARRHPELSGLIRPVLCFRYAPCSLPRRSSLPCMLFYRVWCRTGPPLLVPFAHASPLPRVLALRSVSAPRESLSVPFRRVGPLSSRGRRLRRERSGRPSPVVFVF